MILFYFSDSHFRVNPKFSLVVFMQQTVDDYYNGSTEGHEYLSFRSGMK